jgi:hypothetical protein
VTTATPIPPQDYVLDGNQGTSMSQAASPVSSAAQEHHAGLPSDAGQGANPERMSASPPQAPVDPGSIRDSTSDQYRNMIDGLRGSQ